MRTRKLGRPHKKDSLSIAVHVRFPAGYFDKLEDFARSMRLPVATAVRNVVLDKLDEVFKN